ncbi:type II toxin-antitoxin system RelE/ParE family toxin [Bergeyella porcorum]
MSYEIEFSEDFEKQIPKFKSYPKLMKKIGNFILELKETPKTQAQANPKN